MTIAPERPDAIGVADEEPPVVVGDEEATEGVASAPVDQAALKERSLELVRKAIDAGSVDVALQYLAIEAQWATARRRRRRGWIMGALAALLLVGMVGGVLAYQGLQGGNTGENAPEPLGFGDAPAVSLDESATGAGAAVAPSDGTDVLGVTQEATVDPALPVPDGGAAAALPGAPPAVSSSASGAPATGAVSASGGSSARVATPRPGAAAPAPGAVPAAGAPASPQPTAPRGAAPAPTPTAPTPTAPAGGALDGSWSVIGGSQAGYRVSKRWTLTGADEIVVGRTPKVSGSMTVTQDRVTATSVIIDMASVDSANGIRDAAYRQDILNVASNPTSRFDLTSPIDISGRPAPGTVFTTTATGRLQIRGVTREVTVQIQGRQSGGTIQVVGSIPVTFSDFGITPPNLPIVTVANQGTIEFQVNLSRG